MKSEFVIDRKGKKFVLYAGLLDLAHENGLCGIRTFIHQLPTTENKLVAICTAEVDLLISMDGMEGRIKTFYGIGDAAPDNVTPAMRNCLLRMAETRAKSRALRDAVNIGMASIDELDDTDNEREIDAAAKRQAKQTAQAANNVGGGDGTALPPTPTPAEGRPNAFVMEERGCPECHAPMGKLHATKCSKRPK